jgi:uncharacterized damage-inducible protein DinB
MLDVDTIREIYAFQRWANGRIFEVVAPLTDEEYARDLGGSFPSIRATLTHVFWAEWIWLERWRGRSPKVVLSPDEFADFGALRARWMEVEADRSAFLEALTKDRLAAPLRYVNTRGETWEYPLWQMLFHVANHATYHRGQVINMLRRLGAGGVPTDFLVFQDEVAGANGR